VDSFTSALMPAVSVRKQMLMAQQAILPESCIIRFVLV
jgi:hypothetical protein